ncbi:hypothetical protein F5887DRAFT_916510 [Amanita rubescens]|nr:hypothetical protein F5887DRAFT_916510 [Amanita rubescens]
MDLKVQCEGRQRLRAIPTCRRICHIEFPGNMCRVLASDLWHVLLSWEEIDFELSTVRDDGDGFDDVIRYKRSDRAADEFNTLGMTAICCARHTQSPLDEFAALASDVAAIALELGEYQRLVGSSGEVLPTANFERILVNCQFAAIFPRQYRESSEQDQFFKAGLLTNKIFLNDAARFLQEQETKSLKNPHEEDRPFTASFQIHVHRKKSYCPPTSHVSVLHWPLSEGIDVAPHPVPSMKLDAPSALALSWDKGESSQRSNMSCLSL